MKKTLIALAATAAVMTAVAAPAIATAAPFQARVVVVAHNDRGDHRDNRGHDGRGGWQGRDYGATSQLNAKIERLDDRIDQGRRSGQLSWREGTRLDNELRSIISQKRNYERSGRGLTRSEYAQLDNRLDRLTGQIRYERNDRDNRRW